MKKRNKKGQLDFPIITFFVLMFILILISPIIMKVFNSVKTGFDDALTNTTMGGADVAKENIDFVLNIGITFWDKVIIAAFILATLLLFISSFLVDTHPFWVILYIFLCFMLIMFAGDIIASLDGIYNSSLFATEVNQLSFVVTLRDHFGEFLVGIMVMTGIIMYGKIKFFGSGNR